MSEPRDAVAAAIDRLRTARDCALSERAFRFAVDGRPVSWRRTNVVRGRPTTDRAQREAKARYHLAARAALGRRAWDRSGTYAVHLDAYYPDGRAGDIDRIAGLVLDALETVLYDCDRQVVELHVARRLDRARPRIEVCVRRVELPGPRADGDGAASDLTLAASGRVR